MANESHKLDRAETGFAVVLTFVAGYVDTVDWVVPLTVFPSPVERE